MGTKTAIEWTDSSWTPIRARNRKTGKIGWHCTKPSIGCAHCYSEALNRRLGTGLPYSQSSEELIEIFLDSKLLEQPLHWRTPRKIFVCSMTDLFHDDVDGDFITRVFSVMAAASWHTFQILTKRPLRMFRYIESHKNTLSKMSDVWPIPNIWLGVSVENQPYADERIPFLLQTPAAVRFVSYEPALGPVDFHFAHPGVSHGKAHCIACPRCLGSMSEPAPGGGKPCGLCFSSPQGQGYFPMLDWIIVGGESGPGARPFNIQWARDVVQRCREAGVACFVKQLGSKIRPPGSFDDFLATEDVSIVGKWRCHPKTGSEDCAYMMTNDRKGGDISEWPEDLRVREFPGFMR